MFDQIDRAYYERKARDARDRAATAIDRVASRTYAALAEDYQHKADLLSCSMADRGEMI